MRRTGWLIGMLLVSALPLAGQTDLSSSLLGFEAPEYSVAVAAPPPPSPANTHFGGFGLSGAINVVIAPVAAELDHYLLGRVGDGWDTGHHWALFESRVSRVLGEPTGEAANGDAGEALGEAFVGAARTVAGALGAGDAILTATDPFAERGVLAPAEPGVWQLESGTGTTLTVVTQVPATAARGGRLNGYQIGTYPTAGSERLDAYAPPTAFIEVTPANKDLKVSRHLTLAQFLTKDQYDVWPKYLALDLRLVDKLELVIQELNLMGIRAERIHVMSGFRTPHYNGPGGNGRAALSRHMWGDAADVWIDTVGDGQMDDLNGDGRIDIDDAAVIMRAVERVERKYPELIGGAGTYPTTPAHGPYIHIDARGYRSRW